MRMRDIERLELKAALQMHRACYNQLEPCRSIVEARAVFEFAREMRGEFQQRVRSRAARKRKRSK